MGDNASYPAALAFEETKKLSFLTGPAKSMKNIDLTVLCDRVCYFLPK
jgi:hypothetical protein